MERPRSRLRGSAPPCDFANQHTMELDAASSPRRHRRVACRQPIHRRAQTIAPPALLALLFPILFAGSGGGVSAAPSITLISGVALAGLGARRVGGAHLEAYHLVLEEAGDCYGLTSWAQVSPKHPEPYTLNPEP